MSRFIEVKDCSKELLQEMEKKLNVEIPPSKYEKYKEATTLQLFSLKDNVIYVPFSYSKKIKRPDASLFPKRTITFTASLREEQQKVVSEAVSLLNKNSSVNVYSYVHHNPIYHKIKIF